MRSFFVRWASRLAYALLLAFLFGFSGYFAFNNFVRRGSIAAPDVVGLELGESATLLGERGLRTRHLEDEDRFDDTVPAGRIVQQRPRAGTLMKRGGEIRVTLSRGKQLARVPDLQGQALQAALTELSAVGLQLGRRGTVFWNDSEPGTVVHQSPAGGTEIDRSTPIDILVAGDDPSDTFVMPDLVYGRADVVRPRFESLGFRFGSVKYEPYEGVEPGTILRHTPLAGHPLRRRDAISLVVAVAADPHS
jgi:serine/threonine-protein kinase